jgi:hypothetical protein
MKKNEWKYLVDTLLIISTAGMALIGFLMELIIPEGPVKGSASKYFLGLHRHQWGKVHFILAAAFIVLLVVHLALNWDWIKCMAKKFFKKVWGPALILTPLLAFLVIFLFWFLLPKNWAADEDHGRGSGGRNREAPAGSPGTEVPGKIEGKAKSAARDDHATESVPFDINGQMTLLDIEAKSGVPAGRIAAEIGLPTGAPHGETLGKLRKEYGFTMSRVREAVTKLLKEAK